MMRKHEDHAAWIGVSNKWILERFVKVSNMHYLLQDMRGAKIR